MTTIDLCEIPASEDRRNAGEQFEKFAADFLRAIGFEVLEGPDRGADDGRDLIARQTFLGPLGSHSFRWLVSVKHFVQSNRAVNPRDEQRLRDRIGHFNADGFMAFYSTLPSASLGRAFSKLTADGFRVTVLDGSKICQELITKNLLWPVMRQYLPVSYRRSVGAPSPLVLMTERGLSMRDDPQVALPLHDLLALEEDGSLRFSDRRLEDLATACVIADAIFRGKFEILRNFISFRPVVWRALALTLTWGQVDGSLLADEIRLADSPSYVRLLISIAGEVRSLDTVEPICALCLSAGSYYSKAVKAFTVPVTPFYDVVRGALAKMPTEAIAILEEYVVLARTHRRWQQKKAFEWALIHLRRRTEGWQVAGNRSQASDNGLALIIELQPQRERYGRAGANQKD